MSPGRIRKASWWLEPVPRIYIAILYLFTIVLIGAAVYYGAKSTNLSQQTSKIAKQDAALIAQHTQLTNRVKMDERATCLVQSRGLKANHELVPALTDLHDLLVISLADSAKHPRRSTLPPKAAARALRDAQGLTTHLGAWATLEKAQPQSRKCGP